MAKKKTTPDDQLLVELLDHYNKGTDDNNTRRTRKNGWDDVLRMYLGQLPANWPYNAKISDPRIRTTLLEKTARLMNSKLQGRLVPREGGDIIKAKINNALLDFQWDQANEGGSMLEKCAMMDMNARIFGAAFGLVTWKVCKNKDGEIEWEGNEFKPIDNRDIFMDWTASHPKLCNWAQVRQFTTIEKLEMENEGKSEPVLKNLDVLKDKLSNKEVISQDKRSTRYSSVVKQFRSLDDRMGEDLSFPVVEVITEYRRDKWITFAPKYGVILREIENPYEHDQIPVVMLRYYPVADDIYGESEVEPVMPIAKAINALLSGFVDEMNIKMRPPVKITGTGVRMETIEWGPGAKWIMDSVNNVQEYRSSGEAVNNFNASYSALVAAFNTAMGDSSLGISNVGDFQKPKTATEVNKLAGQQNARDQYNQLYIEQFLKDLMMMWLSNNQQFIFNDPTKKYYLVKVIGKDMAREFERLGLSEMDVPDEAMNLMSGAVQSMGGMMDDQTMMKGLSETMIPKHPVITNPEESDPSNYDIQPKFSKKNENEYDLYVTPDDMEGVYDYIPDVKSMSQGAGDQLAKARQEALQMLLNPATSQMLMQEGIKPKFKEVLVAALEDAGLKDAERFFEDNPGNGLPAQAGGGPSQALPGQGLPGLSPTPDTGAGLQSMAGSLPVQQ